MGYFTRDKMDASSAAVGYAAPMPLAITRIQVYWCQTRQASVVRLYNGDTEISYFLCAVPTTIDHVKETLDAVVFGKMVLNSASIYIDQTRFYSGFLSPVEALVHAINSTMK